LRMFAANVFGLLFGVVIGGSGLAALVFGTSSDARWAGVFAVVVGAAFLSYAVTVLTVVDGVLYTGPFRGRWRPDEMEGVELVPAPGFRVAEQLAVVVDGRARVVLNVTSRPIGDKMPLTSLRREFEAAWIDKSKEPKLPRFWFCF